MSADALPYLPESENGGTRRFTLRVVRAFTPGFRSVRLESPTYALDPLYGLADHASRGARLYILRVNV